MAVLHDVERCWFEANPVTVMISACNIPACNTWKRFAEQIFPNISISCGFLFFRPFYQQTLWQRRHYLEGAISKIWLSIFCVAEMSTEVNMLTS